MTNGNNSISWQRVVSQDSVVEQLPKNSKRFSIPFFSSFLIVMTISFSSVIH